MVRLANRRNSSPNWKCKVGPRVEKQLKKNAESSHDYRPVPSSLWRYEVPGRGVGCQSGVVAQHSVALDLRSCTCQRWDVSGLPCGHGIAAIYSKGMTPDDFVDPYYSKDMYMKAYEPVMHPITRVTEWEKINRPIAPPLYRKQPGRPKTARTKEPGEVAPPPELTKLPEVYYSQVTCGICKQKGHNKRTCKKINECRPKLNRMCSPKLLTLWSPKVLRMCSPKLLSLSSHNLLTKCSPKLLILCSPKLLTQCSTKQKMKKALKMIM